MRKIIIGMAVLCLTGTTFAQKDVVSAVFEKYASVDGFTTVNITGDMLKLMAQAEEQRSDTTFVSKFSEVKILAFDKGHDKPVGVDLRAEVTEKLDKSVYKEMLTVKKSDEDVVILVKELKGRIAELLIVVGGQDENAMIWLKGDILLSEMADLAGRYQMKGFEHLKKLEK